MSESLAKEQKTICGKTREGPGAVLCILDPGHSGPCSWAGDLTVADYEEVLADHRRLVRELDVLLNGEHGAATQASLCDIVGQLKSKKRQRASKTGDDPFNCPKCGAHDYGLFASAMVGSPHCTRAENDRLRAALKRIKALENCSEAAIDLLTATSIAHDALAGAAVETSPRPTPAQLGARHAETLRALADEDTPEPLGAAMAAMQETDSLRTALDHLSKARLRLIEWLATSEKASDPPSGDQS
jgi:hypothetical protein